MFLFDIETLAVESTAAILSFACTHVTEDTTDYQSMLDNSIFIKLDVKDQFSKNRISDEHTLKWWNRQSDLVKQASLIPCDKDLPVIEAMNIFRAWLNKNNFGKSSMFARGMLDPIVLDSLCRTYDISCPIPHNRWLDVRTAIDIIYDSTTYGYVDIDHPTFELGMVLKHHPAHDCAYDGMMLQYGKK